MVGIFGFKLTPRPTTVEPMPQPTPQPTAFPKPEPEGGSYYSGGGSYYSGDDSEARQSNRRRNRQRPPHRSRRQRKAGRTTTLPAAGTIHRRRYRLSPCSVKENGYLCSDKPQGIILGQPGGKTLAIRMRRTTQSWMSSRSSEARTGSLLSSYSGQGIRRDPRSG